MGTEGPGALVTVAAAPIVGRRRSFSRREGARGLQTAGSCSHPPPLAPPRYWRASPSSPSAVATTTTSRAATRCRRPGARATRAAPTAWSVVGTTSAPQSVPPDSPRSVSPTSRASRPLGPASPPKNAPSNSRDHVPPRVRTRGCRSREPALDETSLWLPPRLRPHLQRPPLRHLRAQRGGMEGTLRGARHRGGISGVLRSLDVSHGRRL